jgi:hypothetical protein
VLGHPALLAFCCVLIQTVFRCCNSSRVRLTHNVLWCDFSSSCTSASS